MIARFYKKVKNEDGREISVLNFNAIRNEQAHINIILSERSLQGKTTSGLQHIIERYDKYGERAVLLLNTLDLFKVHKTKMISANKLIYKEQWENVTMKGDGLYKDGQLFCYFVALTAFYKWKIGTRDPNITTIIYDEFNVGLRTIGYKQGDWFENVVRSCNNNVRVFIFGNNLTMATPLLTHFGLYQFPQGKGEKAELDIRQFEYMKYLFYVPQKTKKDIKKLEELKDWTHSLSKKFNLYEITTINQDNYDNNDNIVPVALQEKYKKHTSYNYLYLDFNLYAKLWQNDKGHWFLEHKAKIDNEPSSKIYVFKAKKIEVSQIYTFEFKMVMRAEFVSRKVFFSDFAIKKAFLLDLFSGA